MLPRSIRTTSPSDASDETDSSQSVQSSTAGTRTSSGTGRSVSSKNESNNSTGNIKGASNLLLPPDSSGLFRDGELKDHNFAESSFTEDDVGTSVTECDLTNADTSSVQDMRSMFYRASPFNQDISAWCVEQITQKPRRFDEDAGFERVTAKQPNWGDSCSESGGFLSSLL